jgi:LCP family protein required for cell wall assembly
MAGSDDSLRGRPAAGRDSRGPGARPGEPRLPSPRPGYYPAPPPPPAGQPRAARPAAQQRLLNHIAASRPARRRRLLLTACGVMSTLVLLVAGGAWGLSSYVNAAVGRVSAGVSGSSGGPLNLLVAGVDERSGLTPHQQQELHVGHVPSTNSDTMMLVHVAGDRSRVTVISLPRDSWVDLPGHGMNKINAAFGLGGPRLMVATVQRATGLTVNDFIEVNFLGFIKVIDALGGVSVCLPYAVNDSYSGLRLSAGAHHVNGITALKYARDRHSFALSDLSRIQNQQSLLSSLLREAIGSGTLADPLRLSRFLQAVLAAVKVNQGLNVTSLADQLRGISAGDVRFLTVPLASTNYLTPGGQSAVLWDRTAARQLFSQLRTDQVTGKHTAARPRHRASALRPGQVSADVYNGTMIGGLSADTGAALAQLGFRIQDGLTWPAHDVRQTVIEYPPGQRAAARLVHQRGLRGAALRQRRGITRIRVVLGLDGHTVASPGSSGPAGSGSSGGAAPGSGSTATAGRSAAQAACH